MVDLEAALSPGRAEGPVLHEVQRLPTSGARAVEPFEIDGIAWLVVPQLARDVEGQPAAMTVGDSDVETLVYRFDGAVFVEHQRLDTPGGEDAEFFVIGQRRFLAVASLRRGRGPYELALPSVIHEFRDGRFVPFQSIDGVAAKQWRHFTFDGRHFLALAQGVTHADGPGFRNARSCLLEWDGARFVFLQDVPSAWGYNWAYAEVEGERLLLHADHVEPSCVLRWNGAAFEPFQQLEGASGRAFCVFEAGGHTWLAFARLLGDSMLLRWQDGRFAPHAVLSGPGAREFEWIPAERGGCLVQVNFILGSREAPQPTLRSRVSAWTGTGFESLEAFPTSGGTDAAAFRIGVTRYLAVSNSLSAGLRFRADTVVYRLSLPGGV